MNCCELDISSSFTQPCLSISTYLTWKPHIHSIAKHASQKLGFLSRARGYFLSPQLFTIYKAQIRSSFEYCFHIWGGAPKSSLLLFDKSNLKQSVSSTVQASPILSSLPPIVVWLQIFPFSTNIFMEIALWRSRISFLVQQSELEQSEAVPNLTHSKFRYLIHKL